MSGRGLSQWSAPYFDDPGVSEAVVMDLLDARGQPSGNHVRWYGSLSGPDPGERLPFEAVAENDGVIGDFATLAQAQGALTQAQKKGRKRSSVERMRAAGGADSDHHNLSRVMDVDTWTPRVFSPPSSAAFRRWFRQSQVVDAQGAPLVVYHGTDTAFDAFDLAQAGRRTHGARAASPAVYFTSSLRLARSYATHERVLPVYLSIQNPYRVDAEGSSWKNVFPEAVEAARVHGHDGVIVRNVRDAARQWDQDIVADTYVVFSPHQVKSVYSVGFSPEDPRIEAMSVPTPSWRETLARLEETVQQPGVYDEDDWGDPQTDPERLSDALVAAGFTVLGQGSARLVVALDDTRIAKVAWNPTSNADEMETWQDAKRGGFSALLNPATAIRADNRILVMPRASKVFENAVPKKYQREVRRIQSDLADLLPDRQDPGHDFNYGLIDGEVRCLDYGS